MPYDSPAVFKAIRLIEVLCESDQPLGVSEIAARLGFNTNMAFRLLYTLQKAGWVIKDEQDAKYRMSLRAFHHASKTVSRMSVKIAAAAPLEALWRETGESTYLGVLDGTRMMYLEHLDATRDIRIMGKVGGQYRLHCSAPGKVLLAHGGDGLLAQLLEEGLDAQTRQSITDPKRLRESLSAIRQQDYALDLGEYAEGLMCFAVPVHDYSGAVVAAIGQSVLSLHVSQEQLINDLGPRIIETGRRISHALGWEA